MDHLTLQVGEIDHVVVDHAEGADAGRRQVQRGRRAEPAGAEEQHLRVQQLELALEPDLRQQQVAGVATALLGRERARRLHLVATVLPQRDPACHRGHVLIAEELLQRVRRQSRAVARRAVEDDRLRPVARRTLDARLQVAARHVHGARDVALLELVLLAHVDQERSPAVSVQGRVVDLARVHLADLLLDPSYQL